MSEIDKLGGKVQWLEEKLAEKNKLLSRATDALDHVLPADWYPYGLNFRTDLRKALEE